MFLKTDRVYLRNLRTEDAAVLYRYRNDPTCARYQRWEHTSLTYLQQFVEQFSNCHFLSREEEQHYAICLLSSEMVGDLSCFYNEKDLCITLGITIAPKYHRRGIAREILAEVIHTAQNRHPHLDIAALIDPDNVASIALFEKLGFYRECYAASIQSFVYVIDGKRQ